MSSSIFWLHFWQEYSYNGIDGVSFFALERIYMAALDAINQWWSGKAFDPHRRVTAAEHTML
ncbi:MAG: hypothetical protein ACKOTB_13495 [Planctomycetia bacterium]